MATLVAAGSRLGLQKLELRFGIVSNLIGVADELPVHYRGGVGKSAKRRVGGGT